MAPEGVTCFGLEGTFYEEERYDRLQSQQEERQQKRAVKALERLGYRVTLERLTYSNATKDPGTFKLRYFCIKPLILHWILGIHSQREKPGFFCWITVGVGPHGRVDIPCPRHYTIFTSPPLCR